MVVLFQECPLAQLRKCLLQLLETEVRAYSDAQVEDVLSMSAGAARLFYWLAVETGMWAGELCGLRVCELTQTENCFAERQRARILGTYRAPDAGAVAEERQVA